MIQTAIGIDLGGTWIKDGLMDSNTGEIVKQLYHLTNSDEVLSADVVVGDERAIELFEAAYDEHTHRLARLYANVGSPGYVSGS